MLDDLQAELISDNAATKIRILGINAAGAEVSNPLIIAGCTVPWLQDTVAANVWTSWGAQQRHLQILDTFNFLSAVWDHNTHPLAAAGDANWNTLKALLKQIAGE